MFKKIQWSHFFFGVNGHISIYNRGKKIMRHSKEMKQNWQDQDTLISFLRNF